MVKKASLICSLVLAGSLCVFSIPAWADQAQTTTKSETIYVKLDPHGSQDGVCVVNTFESENDQSIIDYGDYEKVTNLSSNENLIAASGKISFQASSGTFYYQGNLSASTDLPLEVSIAYKLDGVALSADKLGGKSGFLEIHIDVIPSKDKDLQEFVDNYVLQISGNVNTEIAHNIEADKATVAEAGSSKSLSYMVLPGSEEHYLITANVEEFEWSSLQLAAVLLSLAIDLDDGDTTGMTESMSELTDAIAALDEGSGQLAEGSAATKSGLHIVAGQGGKLSDGSHAVSDGIEGLSSGLTEVRSGSQQFLGGIDSAMSALVAQIGNVPSESEAGATLAQAQNAFAALVGGSSGGIDEISATIPALLELVEDGTIDAASASYQIQEMLSGYKSSTIDNLSAAAAGLRAAQQYADAATLYSTLSSLRGAYAELDGGLGQISNGASTLNEQYTAFGEGVDVYVDGVGLLASNYAAFDAGIAELMLGTGQLHEGTVDLDQQLLDGIEDQISEMLGGDFDPVSFVSKENKNIEHVQFIYMIDGVELPEEEPVEEGHADDSTFWSRLLALFGL